MRVPKICHSLLGAYYEMKDKMSEKNILDGAETGNSKGKAHALKVGSIMKF